MGGMNPMVDPANVVQSLVYTLLDVFDATRDLHNTLRNKEKRDYENSLRSKGYPNSRRIEYVDDHEFASDEGIVMDKAAVSRQFELGLQQIGGQFAIGDVISQTALQSQIITLQSVVITTFLYGPTSTDPISKHLSSLSIATRAAGTASVDVLASQLQRQLNFLPPSPRSTRSPVARTQPPPYPVTTVPSSTSASTALIKSHHETVRSGSPTLTNPTIADLKSRPQVSRTDTESTAFSGPTSYGTQSAPHTLFCLYALDLQRHPSQPLSSSITSSTPYCDYCDRDLNLLPGKSWEVFKDDDGAERCFRIQNRFVVKCHRDSADGGYSCVLCSNSASVETLCGDVKALVRHIWMDHSAGELELEEDILEAGEKVTSRRRDSGMSLAGSRTGSKKGDRRSMSLGPSRRKRHGVEREVETYEMRSPRRND